MGCIPEQVLEEIAADIQAAAADIGRKYGMSITFSGIRAQCPAPAYDGITFDVAPLDEGELSDEVSNSELWQKMIGEGG